MMNRRSNPADFAFLGFHGVMRATSVMIVPGVYEVVVLDISSKPVLPGNTHFMSFSEDCIGLRDPDETDMYCGKRV